MRRSFSTQRLMGLVLVVAAGLAALSHPTELRTSLLLFLTEVVLLTGTVGSLVLRGRRRVAWTAFSLFGWFYFLLYFAPLFADRSGMVVPTYRLYERAFNALHPLDALIQQARARPGSGADLRSTYNEMAENFYQSAHLQATLLFALLGALVAPRVLARPSTDGPDSPDRAGGGK